MLPFFCTHTYTNTHTLASEPTATHKATSGLAVPAGHEQHGHLENPFASHLFLSVRPAPFVVVGEMIIYLFVCDWTYQNANKMF